MSKKKRTSAQYVHKAAENEFKREITSSIIYPVMLAIVILLFLSFDLIQGEMETIFWTWIFVTMIAGLMSLVVSYLIITRKHKGRRR
jgi:uncharacterized integral membrane protein